MGNPGRSGDISLFFLSDSIFILGLAMLVNSLATIAIRFFTEKPKEWIESQSLATISVAIAVLGIVHHQELKDRRTEQMYDMKLKEVLDLMYLNDYLNDYWNERDIEENREAV